MQVARSLLMTPQPVHPDPAWTIIIPVKDTRVAKTRLSHLDPRSRASLALAFALDSSTAALRCPLVRRVIVVTNDAEAGRALTGEGVDVIADEPDAGQNPALEHACDVVRREDPGASVAATSSDLPALRAEDLGGALADADGLARWFVADAEGVGTTLLGARAGTPLSPAFGSGSRDRHLMQGAVEVAARPGFERLRRDVDTEADLHEAVLLGVGLNTLAALAGIDTSCATRK
jgi:2-phospho-L-lactate/phosphoenolpyruvate guanylyltransferase